MTCNKDSDWRKRSAGCWCDSCDKFDDLNDCDMWFEVMSGN